VFDALSNLKNRKGIMNFEAYGDHCKYKYTMNLIICSNIYSDCRLEKTELTWASQSGLRERPATPNISREIRSPAMHVVKKGAAI
jgi:hypothetical protein